MPVKTLRALALLPLIVPLMAAGAASPGRADDIPPLRAQKPPFFSADVAISVDSIGHPGVGVTITVPYTDLQWLRVPAGFAAGAEFTVSLEPRRRGRIYGEVWNKRLAVASFAGTRSQSPAFSERRTFSIPPGHYRVQVSVQDLGSQEISTASDDIELPDYSKVPRGFSDLELGVIDSLSGFVAVPARRFGLNASRLAARVSLFDRRPGAWPRSYPFRYRILDDQGAELTSGTQEISVQRSADPVLIRPTRSDLFIGDYVFQLELVEGHSRWRVERSFQVEESGPPRGRDLDRLLEPLSYIAAPGEVERIRALPPAERERAWEDFWRRRDPSPDTPRNEALLEFFRRLRYAEQHFQGFGPGWRSDMGRIYIKYGPPDQTESRPASATTAAVEVWYYNQPYRRFVFLDRDGFGRYILESPTSE